MIFAPFCIIQKFKKPQYYNYKQRSKTMTDLKAEYQALRQQHQFTVMELTDLKQNYEQIKKLNTTILQNMMKQPCEFWNEIKVILDGKLYHDKILHLEGEIEMLRNRMNEEVDRKVQELMRNAKIGKIQKHSCEDCQQCKRLWGKCTECGKNLEKVKILEKVIGEKNQKLDKLILEIQDKRSEIQLLQYRKNTEKQQSNTELEQINKILTSNIKDLEDMLRQQEQNTNKLNQQWQIQYNNLQQHYNQLLAELEQYRNYYNQQQQEQEQRETYVQNQYSKKNNMVKQIQNIMGQLGNRGGGNVGGTNGRMSKYNGNSSRLVQDSDFSNFSIKDAINRPSQFTYF